MITSNVSSPFPKIERNERPKMADATVSAAGLRIVKLLVGNPPQTVSDLIKATNVTRTAVTEQLNELIAAGFVERSTERLPGRGRPRHLYKATDATLLLLFASNQKTVVPAIWSALRDIGGEELVQDVLRRVSLVLAEHYKAKITTESPEDRLHELMRLMNEEGALVEINQVNDQLVMYKRSCGYFSMADARQSICFIDQEMMSAVVGRPVRRVACRHDGAPCCSFEIANN